AGSSAACRSSSPASYWSLPAVWAFIAFATNMPVADCCCTVRADRSTLRHVSVTCSSSPEVSSIAFHAQPPDLPPVPLMELGFAVICPIARHRWPQIQFLSIGSRVCSTLLSDIASRRHLCASLSLHLHQVVKRTFTSKRLNMLGTHKRPLSPPSECQGYFYYDIAGNPRLAACCASCCHSVGVDEDPPLLRSPPNRLCRQGAAISGVDGAGRLGTVASGLAKFSAFARFEISLLASRGVKGASPQRHSISFSTEV